MRGVLLSALVRTSETVTGAPGRKAKVEAIAALLRQAGPAEVPVAVAFLSGELRQRQIGVGFAAIRDLLGDSFWASADGAASASTGPGDTGPGPVGPPLTLADVDAAFAAIGAISGPGTQAERRRLLGAVFSRATPAERSFLTRLLGGELHQGALEGVMSDAVARAAGVSPEEVRRAHLLGGSLPAVAQAALSAVGGPEAASAALGEFHLQVGRALRPMLAASAPTVAAAFERVPTAAVEWKIDGVRIQVHRQGGQVSVFTRSLDDITARLPEITAAVLRAEADALVLDGEAIALGPDGRPRPFQVTASRAGTRASSQDEPGPDRPGIPLTPFFFDVLHLDGRDLIDEPASQRQRLLAAVLPEQLQVPRIVTEDVAEAERFFADAVARGHEGVVVKSLDAPYAAGRRGSEWIKVKPRHTLDLVVLAAEWGHGRRRGWLSNLHLGARDPAGGFVMLGKTFKGLTDQMLGWQTTRLLDLADPPGQPAQDPARGYGVVRVRPELVVEIAFDGVQTSPRYPGGLALRFARVLRYRPDKQAAEADTIDAVRAIWSGSAG
jgi:ATP-dependent DNA ligase I